MLLAWVMPATADASVLAGGHAAHAMSMGTGAPWFGAVAVGLHTASYLVVMTVAAWFVFRNLGLAFLRTAWFNLDWMWAGALVVTGVAVLVR